MNCDYNTNQFYLYLIMSMTVFNMVKHNQNLMHPLTKLFFLIQIIIIIIDNPLMKHYL